MWFSAIAMPQWYVAGRSYYGHAGYTAARARWSDPELLAQRDLSGKHYVVTGANAGLGFAIAEVLAKRRAVVHMVCRDAGRAETARHEIVESAKAAGVSEPDVQVYLADIGSMESVRAFADTFVKENAALHGLINNAGALFNEEARTKDGMEMTMAIALGGTYLLTGLLLPLLKNAPNGRVVNVSSGGQYLISADRTDLLGEKNTGAAYNGTAAYSCAKRMQVELTKQWAAKPGAKGVIFHSMHPGWAVTPGATSSISDFVKKHGEMMRDMYQGADTAVWLAIADEPATKNGLFWLDREEARTDMRLAGTSWSDEDRAQLWKKCEEECGWKIPNVGFIARSSRSREEPPVVSVEVRDATHQDPKRILSLTCVSSAAAASPVATMDGTNDSIVLEEEIDPNYEPTEREVLEYATWLGMDLENEQDLFWIAREGLKAPLPENWKPCKTTDTEEIYYFNFASGQSTWDHPCDEFYRNLYEENKKKRTGGGKKNQETDEKKKKEKEDVAELLGRKGSGKKKKGSLARAEPLGPPTMGRSNPLEKKPLPGLSSKLGVLGAIGGGPTLGGLRSVSSGNLGRLKSESKDIEDSSKDNGEDSGDDQPLERVSTGGLSKPPLGGLLTKKPLPASSFSLSRRDSKAEIDGLNADFEQKKQQILDEQARSIQEIEESHQQTVETMKKKLQKQLEELQEDEEDKLKQKKRELDKKCNDLENQFDKDESNLLRERKEKIKRIESDIEVALNQKRQDLDKEIQEETDRIHSKHEAKLRDMKYEHGKEEQRLEAKLNAALGVKTDSVEVASDHIEKLMKDLASLTEELERAYTEKDVLLQSKSEAETQLRAETEGLQRQVASLRSDNETTEACSSCASYDIQVKHTESECDQTRVELQQLKTVVQTLEETVAMLNQKAEEQHAAAKKSSDELSATLQIREKEIAARCEEVAKLNSELAMLQQKERSLRDELEDQRGKYEALSDENTRLEANRASAPDPAQKSEKEFKLERELSGAQAEALSLKSELSELQDQLMVLSKTNAQVKEQLLKESNEKKSLRKQFGAQADQTSQELSRTIDHLREQVEKLETELSDEQSSQKDLQQLCEQLRSDKQELEIEKRKSESNFALLDSEKRHLDSEKVLLSRQLQELVESQKDQEQSTALAGNADMTKQKWEIEQLQATLKVVEGDKTLLGDRSKQLEIEIESLVATNDQLSEKSRAGAQKAIELENNARAMAMERDHVSDELQTASAELAKWKERAEKKQKEIDQTALILRNLEVEKELAEEALAKEKLEKNDLVVQKAGLEKSKKALESELDSLRSELLSLETTQKSSGSEAHSLHSKLKRVESEMSSLARESKALQEDKLELEAKLRQHSQENVALENKIRVLRSENSEQDLQAKQYEEDLSRTAESAKKVETQLAETQLKWKRECDEKEILSKQINVLNAAREELESTIASLKRKLDAIEAKWKNHESSSTRDDFQLKLKLQQADAERTSVLSSKERVELHLKAIEKELTGTKDELSIAREDSNSLRARIKTLISEKEEIQATLLSSNLANASNNSSSGARLTGFTHASSAEAMLVKLQLADVNKGELEAHLADCASQLEISNRRCAALEARCRDQVVDMESLHVEVSSLRAATQKMHISALETLSLMERLDYEHKKRALKSDFQSQLRDFHEREDQALIRHKARLRSQCEKQLDDLLAELEKKKQVRMEQEGALTLQIIEQIRQEREVKRKELKRQVREEMQELERELSERKDHHLQTITDVIRKEEEALSARVRESRQTLREEELVRANSKQQHDQFPPSPGEVPNQQRRSFKVSEDFNDAEHDEFVVVDAFAASSPRRKSSNSNNKSHHRSNRDESRLSSSMKMQRRKRGSTKEFRKWSKRLENENELLSKATSLVTNQRRELKKQAEQLKRDKDEWRRDQHDTRSAHHNAILQEMKHMIEQNTVTLNQSVKQLREREAWIKKRELNIAKMQRTVEKLRPTRFSSRAHRGNNNNSGYLSDDDDEVGAFSDGECNQSDIDSLLDTLEKLDEELVSEVGELSEDLSGEASRRNQQQYSRVAPMDRYRGWEEVSDFRPVDMERHWPMSYMMTPPPQMPDFSSAGPVWRYPVGSYPASGSRVMSGMDAYHSTDLYTPTAAASSRLFNSSRPFPQRMSNLSHTRRARSVNNNERVPERVDTFQRQISRWAKDREKVQHAATKHASWLAGMCEELKEYGAKYKQDGVERREAETAITLLDEDEGA